MHQSTTCKMEDFVHSEMQIKLENIDNTIIKEEYVSLEELYDLSNEPPPLAPIGSVYNKLNTSYEPDMPLTSTFTCTPGVQLRCTFCANTFTSVKALMNHRLTSHKHVKALFCTVCKQSFDCKSNLIMHLQQHVLPIYESSGSKKLFKCALCEKIFKSKRGLAQHISQLHNRNKLFKCDKCDKYVSGTSSYFNHLSNNNNCSKVDNELLCRFCKKRFFTLLALQRHLLLSECTKIEM